MKEDKKYFNLAFVFDCNPRVSVSICGSLLIGFTGAQYFNHD